MSQSVPGSARVVVIGGGVMGCSVAYHLTKIGWSDVVLLEQFQLTAGTTWHAAGLVGQLRNNESMTRIARYAIDLYGSLEEETGQATGFKQNGAVTIAQNQDRFIELKRHAAMAGRFGVECHVIGSEDVKRHWPLATTDDLVGAIFLPKDGQTNPIDTTQALARGARMGGAKIIERVAVTGIERRGRGVTGVVTDQGRIDCEYVVLCSGLWSRDIAAQHGFAVPLHASEHMYVVTETMEGVEPGLPVLRDYDSRLYIKEDAGKLLIGMFEDVAKPWATDGTPEGHEFGEFDADWDHFEPYFVKALHRIPALENAGIRQFLNGAESFTPDQRYILGPVPGWDRLYVGTGFNSIGIASGAGAGKALAEWMADGAAPMDLWDVDVRRFLPHEMNRRYLRERTVEAQGRQYRIHWPYEQYHTGRDMRLTPWHERLKARGACFGSAAGWERPLWYAQPGSRPAQELSYGEQPWWAQAAGEAKAAREGVALFDLTPFSKLVVQGPDAEAALQRLCTNDVGRAPGSVVYTQMLNEQGGIESDLTVTRLSHDSFMLIGAAAMAVRDRDWIERNLPSQARMELVDVTARYAVLGVMGPRSRALLQTLTPARLDSDAFPFATMQDIDLGMARVLAQRVSYVGELGWELYVPTEQAVAVYDAVVAAGAAFGLRHAGLMAQDSLRLEKAFKHWGHDIGTHDNPLEAGLGFTCAYDKPGGFIGRDAVLALRERGLSRRLVLLTVEEGRPLLLHEEPVYRDGELAGAVTSGAMAFTLDQPIALAMLHCTPGESLQDLAQSRLEVDVAGERFRTRMHLRPPVDPSGSRMRQ